MEETHFTEGEIKRNGQVEYEGNDDRFFNIRGVIMIEWVFECPTVNEKNYLEVLAELRERVRKKSPKMWKKILWFLHQLNAPAPNALEVKQFLADMCIPVLKPPSIHLK
jgi:hypothetical protein